MSNTSVFERENDSILQTYGRLPIIAEKAKGVNVWDSNNNKYLDLLGGIAVNVLGHSHPKIVEAIEEQSKKYLHISNFFYQEPQIKLAEKLKAMSGYDKVFYSNSGAESSEGAIKAARKWGAIHNKPELVAFTGGFHGRTYGALSMMEGDVYKKDKGPFIPNNTILRYNSLEDLETGIDESVAAVMIEFLQGSGGLTVANPDWVAKLVELREKYNFLIIADEVQSGLGRTGKFFSFELFNIEPDIVTIAKGLGGGIPIGAILFNKKTAQLLEKGEHGTTFGGNALACATGNVVLDELENGLMDHINEISSYLKSKLESLVEKYPQQVAQYKGLGLMCGLEFKREAKPIVSKLLDHKIITNATSGTVLRLVPPYVISKENVDEFIERLDSIISEL
jgi:predicted acetylornithine/succinylornithine family transaminase